jgi:hypothetical protein
MTVNRMGVLRGLWNWLTWSVLHSCSTTLGLCVGLPMYTEPWSWALVVPLQLAEWPNGEEASC